MKQKPDAAKKVTRQVSFRMPETEYLKLENARGEAGREKSEFYRDLLLANSEKILISESRQTAIRSLNAPLHQIFMRCDDIAEYMRVAANSGAIDQSQYGEILRRLDAILFAVHAGVQSC